MTSRGFRNAIRSIANGDNLTRMYALSSPFFTYPSQVADTRLPDCQPCSPAALYGRTPPLVITAMTILALIATLFLFGGLAFGQSTFASLVGTVHDTSGAILASCAVSVENQGTRARRSVISDSTGSYSIPNLEPGAYKVTMEAPGFQVVNFTIELTARQTARLDGQMSVASQTESVNVTAEAAPVINTEVSNIAETKTGRELVDLPIAIGSRGTGSTSPMSTLTTQPGVQTDAGGGISVAGAKPSMLSMSIDGISSMGPRAAGPLTELFPSFNSIAEIRVSEVNNSAEFGGISDITTISKSGTNSFDGGAFENLQDTALNARNPFNAVKPVLKMNNYGAYVGGCVCHRAVARGISHSYRYRFDWRYSTARNRLRADRGAQLHFYAAAGE